MDIEWQEDAVCFAGGFQFKNWDYSRKELQTCDDVSVTGMEFCLKSKDFQINTIRQGDYIPKSELDTEDKYKRAVEAFGLLGFECFADYGLLKCYGNLYIENGKEIHACASEHKDISRKLTCDQLITIGEIKRLMNERESNHSAKPNGSVSKVNRDIDAFKPKLATQYLNECIEVQKQRGEQYDSKGTGERSFASAAGAFNAMTGSNLKGSDVCLLLACVKAVRQYSDQSRVHEDSLLDLVSYASLWAEELNKEVK